MQPLRVHDLVDWLAPPRCLACGHLGRHASPGPGVLCAACLGAVRWRAAGDDDAPAGSGLVRCVTLLWLEGPPVEWIHRWKYPRPGLAGLDGVSRALGVHLARLLAERVHPRPDDGVVPIPLHPRRLRARGFNPAAVVARHAFRGSGARWVPGGLVRVRDTPSQAGLGRADRRVNVADAFAWRAGRSRTGPVPRRVWLVDDVVTTGSTLGAGAAALHAAGVEEVVGVGLARTPATGGL